jgi:hypothetical protein
MHPAFLKTNLVLVRDSFDRNDSTTTLGSPWTALSGTWGISSGKAYVPTAIDGQEAVIPPLLLPRGANVRVECDITFATQGIADNGPGLLVRETDASNYLMCRIQGSGPAIWKKVGGHVHESCGAGGRRHQRSGVPPTDRCAERQSGLLRGRHHRRRRANHHQRRHLAQGHGDRSALRRREPLPLGQPDRAAALSRAAAAAGGCRPASGRVRNPHAATTPSCSPAR